MLIDRDKISANLKTASEQDVPAISASIVSKDEILFNGHYGFSDLDKKALVNFTYGKFYDPSSLKVSESNGNNADDNFVLKTSHSRDKRNCDCSRLSACSKL